MKETLILLSIWAIIVFAVQYLLCAKSKKPETRLIPVYIIALFFAAALILYITDMANGSGGVAINAIFAFILCIIAAVAVLADGLAWGVRYLTSKPRSTS